MGAKHWNQSLEPKQRKGPASNFIRYTEMMGSIPPKQVPRSKLPRWASRRVMNIPEETPQGFTPSPLPAAARSSTRPSHLLCICHPKGQKNTPKPLPFPQSRSRSSPSRCLRSRGRAPSGGPGGGCRPRAPPAPPGRARRSPGEEPGQVFLFIFFFSTVHNTFVENEFLFS